MKGILGTALGIIQRGISAAVIQESNAAQALTHFFLDGVIPNARVLSSERRDLARI
jgi:hypothetical protein